MTPRQLRTRKRRRPVAKTAPAGHGSHETDQREPLADARIRPLLERYVSAAGATLEDIGDGLVELYVPAGDRAAFNKRSLIRIAFTLDALERDPEAEIAVVGSPLVEQLVDAIRSRGSRVVHGFVPPDVTPNAQPGAPVITVTNVTLGEPRVVLARHRIVSVLARIVVSAGSAVEEHLVESGCFDATTGVAVPAHAAARCLDASRSRTAKRRSTKVAKQLAPLEPARSPSEVVSIVLSDLRRGFEPKVQKLRAEAQAALATELHRIDGYYASLVRSAERSSGASSAAGRSAYEAEHARRRAEEERRHRVRVVVHPVQLTEWELLVERAEWEITTADQAQRGLLVGERWLNGAGTWSIACPTCSTENPASIALSKSGQIACNACALTCGVCNDVFSRDEEIALCRVDQSPICSEHARICSSCGERHCTTHETLCEEGSHNVCTTCVQPCALCARAVCDTHAKTTKGSSSRGARRLCAECACQCAGANESVGRDEVARCATCDKDVCDAHQATCAIDGRVHCAKHMRRTDGSRRLVCAEHQHQCALEPSVILASDEVTACGSCGRSVCANHTHECAEDGQRYCHEHSFMLRGEPGKFACEAHAKICHLDRAAYRLDKVALCPACGRWACTTHRRACSWCGRSVCLADFNGPRGRCSTCLSLATAAEPPAALVAIAAELLSGATPSRWKTARDAEHTVVEVDAGWKRRLVFSVRHGQTVSSGGKTHTLVGSKSIEKD